jgi:hypothetical protein
MKILVPISLGELYDKISILEIKMNHTKDPDKFKNVIHEWNELNEVAELHPISDDLYLKLKEINQKIWDIEDNIRIEEKNKSFGSTFVEFGRAVYFTNDERARIKKEINLKYDSEIVEEKTYEKY